VEIRQMKVEQLERVIVLTVLVAGIIKHRFIILHAKLILQFIAALGKEPVLV